MGLHRAQGLPSSRAPSPQSPAESGGGLFTPCLLSSSVWWLPQGHSHLPMASPGGRGLALHITCKGWGSGQGGLHVGCPKAASLGGWGQRWCRHPPHWGSLHLSPNAQQPRFQLPCLGGAQHSEGPQEHPQSGTDGRIGGGSPTSSRDPATAAVAGSPRGAPWPFVSCNETVVTSVG